MFPRIHDYEIRKELGRGSEGVVYRVWSMKDKKFYAMKVTEAKGQHEGEVLWQIQGQGVPKLKETFTQGGKEYIVMEWINGQTLKEYIQIHGKVKEGMILCWLQSLGKILCRLGNHEPKIIHLDVKPANIMVDTHGHLYLIDFGRALYEDELPHGYGTKAYASRDQRRGEMPKVTMDYYSLAKTLMACVTNRAHKSCQRLLQPLMREDGEESDFPIALTKATWRRRWLKTQPILAGCVVLCLFLLGMTQWNQARANKVIARYQWQLTHQPNSLTQSTLKETKIFLRQQEKDSSFDDLWRDIAWYDWFHVRKNQTDMERYQMAMDDYHQIRKPTKEDKDYRWICAVLLGEEKVDGKRLLRLYQTWGKKHTGKMQKKLTVTLCLRFGQEMEAWGNPWDRASMILGEPTSIEESHAIIWYHQAKQGKNQSLLKMKTRILHQDVDDAKAWLLYQYVLRDEEEKNLDVLSSYRQFFQAYPKGREGYGDYIICLCEQKQWKEARKVYKKVSRSALISKDEQKKIKEKLGL